jgi:SOS-response transcriptional repressor LexA
LDCSPSLPGKAEFVLGTGKVKLPEWAQKISRLREYLGITQTALADRLKVSPMSVSRWERGTQEPSSEILILLGNLSAEPDNWYFWQAAGLSRKAITDLRQSAKSRDRMVLPATATFRGKASRKSSLVPVPLLSVNVGTDGVSSKHLSGEVETVLAAPKSWCPNPTATLCLHVTGDTMAPLIRSGSVVAIDTSQTNVADLDGKLVIAQHPGSGLFLGRLQRDPEGSTLAPENGKYARIPLTPGWTISAAVLWWVGFAQ